MSDEEKKAIEKIKKILYMFPESEELKLLLNLIEKQQKEIEELSDKLTQKICKGVEEEILEEYRQTIIFKDKEIEELKDKIKAFIKEELEVINEKCKELEWLK